MPRDEYDEFMDDFAHDIQERERAYHTDDADDADEEYDPEDVPVFDPDDGWDEDDDL